MKTTEKNIKISLILIWVILFIFSIYKCNSQNYDRFTIFNYTEPQHYSKELWKKADGFNCGFGIQYQMPKLMYFGIETYIFPNLNNISYWDIQGSVGLHHRSRFDNWRLYGGIQGGFINRQGWGHPKFGFQVGVEYYFNNNLYWGLRSSYSIRGDGGVWGKDEKNYWGFDSGLIFGFYW